MDFTYYQLATSDYDQALLTEVVMAGYPLGGERFEKISVNEGKVQSINKDTRLGDEKDIDRIYVDLTVYLETPEVELSKRILASVLLFMLERLLEDNLEFLIYLISVFI